MYMDTVVTQTQKTHHGPLWCNGQQQHQQQAIPYTWFWFRGQQKKHISSVVTMCMCIYGY